MRNTKLIGFLTAGCLAIIFITACSKEQNNGCAVLYNAPLSLVAAPVITLQIVDSQNRDLLNYATPNHYDTLAIKQLNTNKLVFISKTYPGNITGKNYLLLYCPGGEYTNIYSLSSTDQDTVYTNNLIATQGCTTSQKLAAFKYNGKSYTDTLSKQSFVIVK